MIVFGALPIIRLFGIGLRLFLSDCFDRFGLMTQPSLIIKHLNVPEYQRNSHGRFYYADFLFIIIVTSYRLLTEIIYFITLLINAIN